MVEDENGFHFKTSEFKPGFIIDLNKDLSKLKYLLRDLWESITIDPNWILSALSLEGNKSFWQ